MWDRRGCLWETLAWPRMLAVLLRLPLSVTTLWGRTGPHPAHHPLYENWLQNNSCQVAAARGVDRARQGSRTPGFKSRVCCLSHVTFGKSLTSLYPFSHL